MKHLIRGSTTHTPVAARTSGDPGLIQLAGAHGVPTVDRQPPADDRARTGADQSMSDADQSLSDADQSMSDADQAASDIDQTSADGEQRASDVDQAVADRDHRAAPSASALEEQAYQNSREERAHGSLARVRTRLSRLSTAGERDRVASARDLGSIARDRADHDDEQMDDGLRSFTRPDSDLLQRLAELNEAAAATRARAALERERAAAERLDAARIRAHLEAELRIAHLDQLTGAYRREMGELALEHEIDRARRSDGRFVLAFLDVDGLKAVNDRDGHAAGDQVLRTVAQSIKSRLRTFDPFVRYGGDEFLCGLGGVDISEAAQRFTTIERAIRAAARVGVSVGLAGLRAGDTVSILTERADEAMLQVKAQHHMRA